MKFLFVLLIPIILLGQNNTSKTDSLNYSFSFYLTPNPNLFITKKLSKHSSLRLAITISASSLRQDQTETRKAYRNTDTLMYNYKNQSNITSVDNSISFFYIYRFAKMDSFNAYFGLGPAIGYGYSNTPGIRGIGHKFSYSVLGVAGLSYQVNKRLYFLAEYRVARSYSTQKFESTTKYPDSQTIKVTDTYEIKEWKTSLSRILIGIGIKF